MKRRLTLIQPSLTTIKYCLIFHALFIFANQVYSQDLENLQTKDPIKVSGGLNVRTIFYNANGIENRRRPFSYIISGGPTISLYDIQIPISFVFSEQERSFRQPFNQIGMSPTYKWITVHAGYRNITFSPYTMAGHTILGAGVELNPGKFRFGFLHGRLNRATAVDTTSGSLEPFSFTRRGYALKAGIGDDSKFLDFTMVKAKDDSTSASGELPFHRPVTPAENLALGLGSRLTFLKKFYWEGEGAISIYTQNINSSIRLDSAEILPQRYQNALNSFMTINGSTEFYSAFHTSLGYRGKGYSLRLQYRRVDPRYQSMGAYFFNNDVENITITPTATLLKNKIRFNGSLGFQRDNLQNQKQATANRVIGAANISADLNEKLGMDLNFTNFTNSQRSRTILLADSFLIAQTTRNLSITPRYIHTTPTANHVVIFSFNRMELMDQNARTSENNNIESNHIFLNYQLSLNEKNTSFNLNLNSTKINLANGLNSNEGITVGIQKRILDKKLMLGWNSSLLRSVQLDRQFTILNNGIRGDLQAHKMHRVNFLFNHIGNIPQKSELESSQKGFTELRGEIGYNFIF